MPFRWDAREHLVLATFVLKWLAITIPLGVAVGSAVALFLAALDFATELHWQYPWLLYLLPLAGLLIGLVYQAVGASAEGGNNLILEQIHEPGGGVPLRMAPLVLLGTLLTHLFGGSAGREGTAVQMGGSLASRWGRLCRLDSADMRIVLTAGVAAGFGAVFGTPLAGAVFALEVVAVRQLNYRALMPCLIASITGDYVTTAWGIGHTHYTIETLAVTGLESSPPFSWLLAGKVAIAAVAFGLASVLFAELAHGLQWLFKTSVRWPAVRPVVGGILVIALVWLLGERDYLGLGVQAPPHDPSAVTIQSCFEPGGAAWLSWWWKILFTAITVSSGFKGGEVTPLFFIGAALGNVLAQWLGAPVDLLAGLGFVAVFAGATNTPLACTLMGLELFAPGNGPLSSSGLLLYLAIACFLSYLMSGRSGIYLSQRIGTAKLDWNPDTASVSLRTLRERRNAWWSKRAASSRAPDQEAAETPPSDPHR
jgi:H+/Cl- antiporter ClcA